MLEVSGLSRRYADILAVDQVSFTIGSSEIVGLLGHNGAGKTTIMKILSGYLEPHAGHVRINSLDLASHAKKAQQRLGYLPENLPVYPELTVVDYLHYTAGLKGLTGNARRAEIRRVIKDTDIDARALEPIATLSRGYKQRVGVAQALLGRPSLLILDEPTNGLDPTQTEHMRELIRDIARQSAVILSTHIMQEVEALCDRVLILNHGRLAVDERLKDLQHSNHLFVECSLTSATARPLFTALQGVAQVEDLPSREITSSTNGIQRFRLTPKNPDELRTLTAAVARTVLNSRGELYELRAGRRNLETLFREVSKAPGSRIGNASNEGIHRAT